MPTLRLRRALEQAPSGAEVRLLADDPLARIDVPHFAAQMEIELLEAAPLAHGGWSFRLRKP